MTNQAEQASSRQQRGLTLVEIIIMTALIGSLASIAIKVYSRYTHSIEMTSLAANFEEAVNVARNVYIDERAARALGNPSARPKGEAEWIALLSRTLYAGPGKNRYAAGDTAEAGSGLIGVTVSEDGESLTLVRSSYRSLPSVTATVNSTGRVTSRYEIEF